VLQNVYISLPYVVVATTAGIDKMKTFLLIYVAYMPQSVY